MRRIVSIALRILLKGFLISWATSAANRSVASIRVHNAAALSAIIQLMEREPSERSRMGKLAAEHIKGFSTDEVISSTKLVGSTAIE